MSNTKTGVAHDESGTDWSGYARGVGRSIAENEYHQPRQRRLTDYWNRPSGEDVVEIMMERGFGEDTARKAVRELWRQERRRMEQEAVDA